MQKSASFQTILLFIFGIGALIGVAFFALSKATNSGSNLPRLEMWGTLPASYFDFLGPDKSDNIYFQKVTYREIRKEDFDQMLLEALADGTGPDLIVINGDDVYKQRRRLYEIPFESYSASKFANSYIPAGQIFQSDKGFYALPAVVDPLVMYFNRSILSSNAIASPPKSWDVMRDFSERVTKTDGFLNIDTSAVSLGTFANINHAKNILSLLLMQSGSRITAKSNGRYVADFSQSSSELSLPPSEALNFYTEFADPSKSAYSWNSSLPMSKTAFLSEDLALYFGLASEEKELVSANPNLSFGVAMMPQVGSTSTVMTTGDIYGFAVMKNTAHVTSAFTTLFALADTTGLSLLNKRTGLPSVHRALLKEDPTRASSSVFVNSALVMRTWVDPDSKETNKLFADMVDSVRSSQLSSVEALARLTAQLNKLFSN